MLCRCALDLTPGTDVVEQHCWKFPLALGAGQTVRPQEGGGGMEEPCGWTAGAGV